MINAFLFLVYTEIDLDINNVIKYLEFFIIKFIFKIIILFYQFISSS